MHRVFYGIAVVLILALVAGCEGGPRPIRFESPAGQPDTADGLYRVRATRVAALRSTRAYSVATCSRMSVIGYSLGTVFDGIGEPA